MRHALAIAAGLALLAPARASDAPHDEGFGAMPSGPMDHITEAERQGIWREIDRARQKLALPKDGARPAFIWPLRSANGYAEPFIDSISNFVDHDAEYPSKLRDYNCGTRTYDRNTGYNHRGIDISLWPDSWNLMANRHPEIVAAAPGVIVFKSDGNFDRNCAFDGGTWNAVYVQHDDGSIAWYGHMKSGSLTAKAVGERVVAGERLGNVGSSGSSTGPHLHFEVYDASKRLVDPFAGACNTLNPESWWASQPEYYQPRLNRVLTASAPPVFSTCGADGRLENPGTFNEQRSFKPGDLAYFVAAARDMQPSHVATVTIRRPDGSVWRQRQLAAASSYSSRAYWYLGYVLEATAPTGTWLYEAEIAGTRAQAAFDVTADGEPRANYTDLWWNPAESGWGVNLIHQGDVMFATWFTYDTDRAGMWLVMSDARLQPDGSFSGTIHRTTGTPLAQISGSAASTGSTAVGNGVLRFASPQQASFAYTVNGVSQQKTLQRFAFGTAASCSFTAGTRLHATNYQDLWWNPSESGWGINVAHQGDVLFATWFTYGADGRGQWLVASEMRRQGAAGEYGGALYRTTGTPLGQINGAAAASTYSQVGSITLAFTDGQNARMDYTVDGVAQSKPITRFLFATPQTLCR
jgi:murein DD-endopeptidase MepM/ murein hydrolase activator NlpD